MTIDVKFTRAEWQACFSKTANLDVSIKNTTVPPSEVETIYVPLVTLISKWRDLSQERQNKIRQTLNMNETSPAPYLIGLAGSVAAGKSTTSRLIAELLMAKHPETQVVTLSTDHFLFSNGKLQTRGIMDRKGFPESYDWARLHQVLADLKAGKEKVKTPIYSHEVYDITGETYELNQPDVVILEGINVLQAGRGFRPITDWLDLKIYVNAEESSVFNWYWKRVQHLVATADENPSSYFHQFKEMDHDELFAFAKRIWQDINSVNLHENILPSRERADVILEKGPQHEIQALSFHMIN